MLIIFVVALSEFDRFGEKETDQTLNEIRRTRLREAFDLFNAVLDYCHLNDANYIILLNKIDVFKEKLASGKKVSEHFPDFSGPDGDYKAATDFFKSKFLSMNETDIHKQLFIHETCLIDDQNFLDVCNLVNSTILEEAMNNMF